MRSNTVFAIFKPGLRPLLSLLAIPTPTRLWLALFAIWVISLSGLVGVPGVYQALRLQSLLDAKKDQLQKLETQLKQLQQEATLLEKNKVVQQREIRRVLGYAASDEIIFDFTQEGQF